MTVQISQAFDLDGPLLGDYCWVPLFDKTPWWEETWKRRRNELLARGGQQAVPAKWETRQSAAHLDVEEQLGKTTSIVGNMATLAPKPTRPHQCF